jgi:hypothetical protein
LNNLENTQDFRALDGQQPSWLCQASLGIYMGRQGWNFRAPQAFESMMVRSVGVESKLLPERESVVMFFCHWQCPNV